MPAVVQEFVSSHDIGKVVQIQNDIIQLYRKDIELKSGSDYKKHTARKMRRHAR